MVRVSLVLRLQPRDEQEPCAGQGIFGSRKLSGTPEPGSSWSLSGRTGGRRRARWLLLIPVRAEQPTLMSQLRVQGAPGLLWSLPGHGSPHTQALKPLPVSAVQGLRAAVWSLTAAPALGVKETNSKQVRNKYTCYLIEEI